MQKFQRLATFFLKELCVTNAIYGGELSGHHYFRDFYFCDSGMLPAIFGKLLSKQKFLCQN